MAFSRADRAAFIKLSLALTFVGIIAGYYYYLSLFDRDASLCNARLEQGQTIVLIDKTDAWNTNQSSRLEMHVMDILQREMHQDERLRVFSFGATFVQGFPEHFAACKPPDGRECNGVFCNKTLIERTYRDKFLEPLKNELKTLKVASVGETSPIAEVLAEVLSRSEIRRQPGKTRLVLISDMAQNSDVYTVFRTPPRPPPGAQRRPPVQPGDDGLRQFFERARGSLKTDDVSVVVFQLFPDPSRRPPHVGELAQSKWKEVFQMLGFRDRWERL